ncbi:kynurenine--oxoglutarate transaminase 3-like isoform X2 [Dysidea avara]|uniref:kynurenine--oxoglutarate transaminase 3-like isoform X2 n=1 Tax=Dysidea avara TaxID=196820 RepID=UPI003316CADC
MVIHHWGFRQLVVTARNTNPLVRTMASSSISEKFAPAARLEGIDKNVWVEFVSLVSKYQPVNLGQGFPDFAPPDYIVEALKEASGKPLIHQYTRSQGHPRLVKALANMFSKVYNRDIDGMSEIITTIGSYNALFYSFQSFVHPGDEVVVIEPFFDCYSPMTKMAGGVLKPVPLRPKNGATSSADWVLDPAELEAAFSPKTKLFIINTPNNPLGKIFTRSELEMMAEMCHKYNVLCISDEVYEWLIYDDNVFTKIATLPGMWDRTITIGSAGKTFSMTGWKTGWAVGPAGLIKHMQTVNANSCFTAPTILQEAIAVGIEHETAVLGQDGSYFKELPRMLQVKRDEVYKALKEVGMNPIIPQGGYFMLANTSNLGLTFDNNDEAYDFQVCKWMIANKGLGAIPPSAFYSSKNAHLITNYIRFNFAKSDETVKAALQILQDWAKEIH